VTSSIGPSESDDIEDISFSYEPEELGLDAQHAAKINQIKQIRPLHSGQPWGIFWVSFEKKRLPVVVLRRILGSLVVKSRKSANSPDRPRWGMNDLLFVSAYGDEATEQREIAFAILARTRARFLPSGFLAGTERILDSSWSTPASRWSGVDWKVTVRRDFSKNRPRVGANKAGNIGPVIGVQRGEGGHVCEVKISISGGRTIRVLPFSRDETELPNQRQAHAVGTLGSRQIAPSTSRSHQSLGFGRGQSKHAFELSFATEIAVVSARGEQLRLR